MRAGASWPGEPQLPKAGSANGVRRASCDLHVSGVDMTLLVDDVRLWLSGVLGSRVSGGLCNYDIGKGKCCANPSGDILHQLDQTIESPDPLPEDIITMLVNTDLFGFSEVAYTE